MTVRPISKMCARRGCKHSIDDAPFWRVYNNPKGTPPYRDYCEGCGRSRMAMSRNLYECDTQCEIYDGEGVLQEVAT